jgi:hypothetical protein
VASMTNRLKRTNTSMMVHDEDGTRVSVADRTDQLRAWLALVFEAAAQSKLPKPTKRNPGDRNPFLQASFVDHFFDIGSHVAGA